MAKNRLQEWCQHNGYSLPVYESTQTGPPHRPIWKSMVYVLQDMKFSGDDCATKSLAEASAATKALSNIIPLKTPASPVMVKKKTALLVDVENLPKLISQLPSFEGPMVIYAFIGKHHPLASINYSSEVNVILSPSTRPDGTDTCMQVYVGKMLCEHRYEFYLIATRDHFGAALVDIITSDSLAWSSTRATLVSTSDHIREALADL